MGNVKLEMLSFRYWVELGTLRKATLQLERDGFVSPRTGKAYTVPAIYKFALTWLVNHPDEVRPILEEEYRQTGETLTDEEWEEFLWRRAKQAYRYNKSGFEFWINTIGKETEIGKKILFGENSDS